jgi:hypothetical protein
MVITLISYTHMHKIKILNFLQLFLVNFICKCCQNLTLLQIEIYIVVQESFQMLTMLLEIHKYRSSPTQISLLQDLIFKPV